MPSDSPDVLRLKGIQIDSVEEISVTLSDLSFAVAYAFIVEARRLAEKLNGGLQSLARTLTAYTDHLDKRSEQSWDLPRFVEFCAHMERHQAISTQLAPGMADASRNATE